MDKETEIAAIRIIKNKINKREIKNKIISICKRDIGIEIEIK